MIDLEKAVFPCVHTNCPWAGKAVNHRDHMERCKYAPVSCIPCTYSDFGCPFEGDLDELSIHEKETTQHLQLVARAVKNKRDLDMSERVLVCNTRH